MNRSSQLVLSVLQSECRHMDATEVWDLLRKRGEEISMATVYNSVKSLQETGEIRVIQRPGEGALYDARLDPHAHLHCENCGKLSDIDITRGVAALEREARDLSGYGNLRTDITLHGHCPECQKKDLSHL